jgi:lysophospholipase L1-like esterase
MKNKYLFTLLIFLSLTSCLYGQKLDRFESTITEFEKEDKNQGLKPEAILFTGSSSIKMWKTLAEDFSPIQVINRGFGGSTIPEVTYYADRIILPHKPKLIVFYCGENDLANDEAKSGLALKSFKEFSEWMKNSLPDTKLFFIAIKPSIRRWHYWPKMNEANKLLKTYINQHNNYFFIDVASKMLDNDGVVLQDIFIEDNLHLNEKGYSIWTETIKPVVEKYYAN